MNCACSRPMAFDDTCGKCGRRVRGEYSMDDLDLALTKIAFGLTRRQRTGGDQPRRK